MVDGVGAADLGAPEPVDLHQPQGPVAERHALVALHGRLVLPEGGGHVAPARRRGDLEVGQLGQGLRADDLRLTTPLLEAVEQPPVHVLGRLAGPGGVGADQADEVAVTHALRDVETPPV